jgi:hypothetical protein
MSEPTSPAPTPSDSSDAEPEPITTGLPDSAPTEAGPAAREGTVKSPTSSESATVEAWSDETESIDEPQTWRKTWIVAAIFAVAGIGLGAAIWFGTYQARPGPSQSDSRSTTAPAPGPTPTTNAAPPPAPAPAPAPAPSSVPPTTVTAQASPTAQAPQPDVGISPEMVAWYDRQFIANLRYNGASITDPVALALQAHRACAMLQKGATQEDVIQKIVAESGWNYFTATMFTSTAMSTYPGCS